MIYRIKVLRHPDIDESYSRKRSDAADYLLRRITRKIIEENAGLDTQQGRAVMSRAEDLDVTKGGAFTAYDRVVVVTASRTGS